MGIENLYHSREVCQGAGKTVDLVGHHNIYMSLADVGEQTLQRRPLGCRTRKPAVVVGDFKQAPALTLLALDEGLARLALGVQRVEVLRKSFFGGLARIDRAAAN